jgi:hypothetical protein
MIPALLSSVAILFMYWRENRPKPGVPEPGSAEALQGELAALNARLDAVHKRMSKG